MASKAFRGFIPLFDRVLVQKIEPVTKSKGGLYIPEAAQAKVNQAIVRAHGPGGFNQQTGEYVNHLEVGNKVLLPEFGGSEVKLQGEGEFMLFRQSDFLGKFD